MSVVICEDSRTYAHALRTFLETDGDFTVVSVCTSAEELLSSLAELDPQLITMDLELPAMDGLWATREVMRRSPRPIVVISSHTDRGSERAAAALAAGALDAVPKDHLPLDGADSPAGVALRRRLRRLALSRSLLRTRRRGGRSPARAAATGRPSTTDGPGQRPAGPPRPPGAIAGTTARRTSVIAIAASTGGPQALNVLLGDLPPDFSIPVLVVQHIAAGFVSGLARWLDSTVGVAVQVASDGALATSGVWLAPDNRHLVIGGDLRMHLDDGPAPGRHRPSADVLLHSMAASLGRAGAAVVLTGMGRDGAEGAGAMVAAGGLVIAQDASTAVINGMPAAAVKAGAQACLPLHEMAPALRALRPAQ